MSWTRLLLLPVIVLVAASCANIGGRWRPAWSKSWSDFACQPGDEFLTVQVWSEQGDPVPGVTITITSQKGGPWTGYTDETGVAEFDIGQGDYKIQSDIAFAGPMIRNVRVEPSQRCRLTLVPAFENLVTIQ